MDSTQSVMPQNYRPTANYRPSVWGNQFLRYASTTAKLTSDATVEPEYEGMKEVRRLLISTKDKLSEKLMLIDAIERLGVSYHFYKEIDDILENIFHATNDDDECTDLYTLALQFRLLRQHGFNASSDVFTKFKDDEGNFKESIISDVRGILSLYEASHLRIHGETILDEALSFTTLHLKSKVTTHHVSSSLAKRVTRALEWPLHKCFLRQEVRNFFSMYQEDESYNETLLKFAKVDFSKVQEVYQKELGNVTRWWKDLDFERKLPYARDRIPESYLYTVAMCYEPQYHLSRMWTTKAIAMVSIIDDTFDAYGTFEEISLFMEAVERWDIKAVDKLPEYMKPIYPALLEMFDEIEEETTKGGRPYCAYYAREAMKGVARAYFAKVKWYHEGYVPTVEEYLISGATSSAYVALVLTLVIGAGNSATKVDLDWLVSDPSILRASCVIGRIMNDIVSHKFEQERGHAASVVECYMKEHNASEEQAYEWVKTEIEEAWKVINKGCLRPTPVRMSIPTTILNVTRTADFAYHKDDGYTVLSQRFLDSITALIIEPLPIDDQCY